MTAQINVVFDPPLLTDAPETFDAKAQDMGTKLNPWASEANALALDVNATALDAAQSKTDAQTAASTATIQAGLAAGAVAAAATTWVSGDSYTVNELVWLTGTSGSLYRCIQTHSGRSTPPDSDTDYWANTVAESALSSKLTGLSLADTSAVTATDTVLQAVGKLQAGKASLSALNAMWPVGSIYINASSAANPGAFLPGTWEQLTSGFLYPQGSPSSGAAGATGGEVNHTLSLNEMPVHQHTGTTSWNGDHTHSYSYEGAYPSGLGLDGSYGQVAGKSGTTSTNGGHNHTFTTDAAGGGAAHNNMPPFLTVYMFKRVS